MLRPCIICSKLGCGDPIDPTANKDPLADDDDDVKYEGPSSPPVKLWTLDQFFTFLGRYLDNSHLGTEVGGQRTNWVLLENVIDIMDTKEDGWNSCENCSKIAETFCELYDQLKTIQLRLNHQVQKLEEVMPPSSKMKKGSEEVDESCDAMSDFKRDLLKRCREKLKASPPTLKLMDCVKVKSEPGEDEPMPPKLFHEDSPLPPGILDDLEDDDYAPSPSSSADGDANSEDGDGDGAAHLALNNHNPHTLVEMVDEATREAEPNEAGTTKDLLQPKRRIGPTIPWKSTYNPETLKHRCGYCPKEFVNRCSVRAHYRSAHSQVPYNPTLKCGTCGEQFTLRSQYNRHRKIFHPPGSTIKCNRCGEAFKLKRLLKRHQLKPCKLEAGEEEDSSGAKPEAIPEPQGTINPLTGMFSCDKCPREFTSNHALQDHVDCEHLNQRFNCVECNKSYRCKMSILRHQRIVHQKIKLNCPKCGKPFNDKATIRKHLHTCGTGMVTVGPRQKCPICGKDIACKGLKTHMKSVHLNVRDHICSDCGKGFVLKSDLQSHVRCVHLQLRDHLCDICGKKFKNGVNLRIHRQKIHSVTA